MGSNVHGHEENEYQVNTITNAAQIHQDTAADHKDMANARGLRYLAHIAEHAHQNPVLREGDEFIQHTRTLAESVFAQFGDRVFGQAKAKAKAKPKRKRRKK